MRSATPSRGNVLAALAIAADETDLEMANYYVQHAISESLLLLVDRSPHITVNSRVADGACPGRQWTAKRALPGDGRTPWPHRRSSSCRPGACDRPRRAAEQALAEGTSSSRRARSCHERDRRQRGRCAIAFLDCDRPGGPGASDAYRVNAITRSTRTAPETVRRRDERLRARVPTSVAMADMTSRSFARSGRRTTMRSSSTVNTNRLCVGKVAILHALGSTLYSANSTVPCRADGCVHHPAIGARVVPPDARRRAPSILKSRRTGAPRPCRRRLCRARPRARRRRRRGRRSAPAATTRGRAPASSLSGQTMGRASASVCHTAPVGVTRPAPTSWLHSATTRHLPGRVSVAAAAARQAVRG